MVYNNTYYSLSEGGRVVGYSHSVSNSPRRLPAVGQAQPWTAKINWDEVLLVRSGFVRSVIATLTCGKLRIMVHADCYNFSATGDMTVPPSNLSECHYRGLFIDRLEHSKPTPGKYYPPHTFSN